MIHCKVHTCHDLKLPLESPTGVKRERGMQNETVV